MGDDPRDGIRYHIDAIFSSPEQLEIGNSERVRADLSDLIAEHMPGRTRLYDGLYVRREEPREGWLNRLYNHGKYSGRPTLNTAAIYAGSYGSKGRGPYRLTNVGNKDKAPGDEGPYGDIIRQGGGVILKQADLQRAQAIHVEARKSMPRALLPRNHNVSESVLEEILSASWWRYAWRLGRDDQLRKRFL